MLLSFDLWIIQRLLFVPLQLLISYRASSAADLFLRAHEGDTMFRCMCGCGRRHRCGLGASPLLNCRIGAVWNQTAIRIVMDKGIQCCMLEH